MRLYHLNVNSGQITYESFLKQKTEDLGEGLYRVGYTLYFKTRKLAVDHGTEIYEGKILWAKNCLKNLKKSHE